LLQRGLHQFLLFALVLAVALLVVAFLLKDEMAAVEVFVMEMQF
jgi:hypothetical protein